MAIDASLGMTLCWFSIIFSLAATFIKRSQASSSDRKAHSVLNKKVHISIFTARNRRDMDKGCADYSRLCGGKTARLGKKYITGADIVRHLVGKFQNLALTSKGFGK